MRKYHHIWTLDYFGIATIDFRTRRELFDCCACNGESIRLAELEEYWDPEFGWTKQHTYTVVE